MKNNRRTLVMILSVILCVCLFALPVMAQTATQDGLEVTLTADKAEYAAGEDIVATLTVKNTTTDVFKGLKLEHVAPKGFEGSGEASKTVEALAAGESVSIVVTYSGSIPETGDMRTHLVAGVMVLTAVALVALLVTNKKLRTTGISMLLCCVLVGGLVIGGVAPAHAATLSENVSVSTDVKVNGVKLTLKGKVSQEEPADPVIYNGMTASELDALPTIRADEFDNYMNVVWNFGWDSSSSVADKVDFAGTATADSKIWKLGKVGEEGTVLHDNAGWGVMMWTRGTGNIAYMYSKLDVPETVNEFRIWAGGLSDVQFSGSGAIRAVAWYKDESGNYVKQVMVPLSGLFVGGATAYHEEDGTFRYSNAQGWTIPDINNGDGMIIYDMGNLRGKTDVVIFVEAIGVGTVLGTADTQTAGGVPEGEVMPECVIIKRVMFL